MYMIRVEGSSAVTAINKRANENAYIPADRCTWEQLYNQANGQYELDRIYFWHLTGSTESTRLDDVAGVECSLGYIGKSGRFVPITG